MRSFDSIRAITLDAEGTLLHPYPSVGEVYAEVLAQNGVNVAPSTIEESFRKAFAVKRREFKAYATETSEKTFWRSVVRDAIGIHCSGNIFDPVFEELYRTFGTASRWRLAKAARATLEILKGRGYRLAVLSNWDRRLRGILNELALERYFEHYFISSELGIEKPDVRIFHAVQDTFGLDPGQILHVGDSPDLDGDGALGACWAFILVSQERKPIPASYPVIPNLGMLPEMLPDRTGNRRSRAPGI